MLALTSIWTTVLLAAAVALGALADRFGRKPVMIGGFVLFAIASIMAILASIMALAPAIAPTIGGFMMVSLGWQSLFLALGAYSLLMAVVVAFGIPEPMKPEHRQSLAIGSLLRNYRRIGSDIGFIGYTLTNSLAFAGLFAFLSGSSFVLIEFFGVRPEHFGLFFACVVAGYIAGNLLAIRLGRSLTPDQILLRGLITSVIGGLVMSGLALESINTVWAIILPQIVFMAGVGLLLPQTMAGALASFPSMAGSASALFGFIQMMVAAMVGVLVGYFHNGTPVVMASIIGICAVLALASYLLLVRNHAAAEFQAA